MFVPEIQRSCRCWGEGAEVMHAHMLHARLRPSLQGAVVTSHHCHRAGSAGQVHFAGRGFSGNLVSFITHLTLPASLPAMPSAHGHLPRSALHVPHQGSHCPSSVRGSTLSPQPGTPSHPPGLGQLLLTVPNLCPKQQGHELHSISKCWGTTRTLKV